MNVTIRPLTRLAFESCPDDFVAIARDVPGEYWKLAHFQLDLPMKWELSQAAWAHEQLVGYSILSSRSSSQAHLHHFMVSAAHRGHGLGTRLLDVSLARVREAGHSRLTLKVAPDAAVRRLYERSGFQHCGDENGYLVYGRDL